MKPLATGHEPPSFRSQLRPKRFLVNETGVSPFFLISLVMSGAVARAASVRRRSDLPRMPSTERSFEQSHSGVDLGGGVGRPTATLARQTSIFRRSSSAEALLEDGLEARGHTYSNRPLGEQAIWDGVASAPLGSVRQRLGERERDRRVACALPCSCVQVEAHSQPQAQLQRRLRLLPPPDSSRSTISNLQRN